MKVRRVLSVILMVVFVCSLVSGCGSNSSNSDTTSQNEENTASGTEDISNVPELIFYMVGPPQRNSDMVWEKINEILVDEIGAKVKFQQFDWGEYDEKMNLMINSGDIFDICFTASSLNPYLSRVRQGAFAPLDDLLQEHGQGIIEAVDPAFLEGAKVDGVLYAIPVNKEIGRQTVVNVNVAKAEGAGIDYTNELKNIKTIADLEPILAKAYEKYKDEPNFTVLNCDGSHMAASLPYAFIYNNFGIYFDTSNPSKVDHKVTFIYDTPEAMDFFKTMRKYWQAGYIRPDQITNPHDKTAINESGSWFVELYSYYPLYELIDSAQKGYKVDVVKPWKGVITTETATGSMHAVSVTSQHKAEAMKFLNVLNTNPEVRQLASYGIPGIHYEEVGDRMKLIPDSGYAPPNFAMGNFFVTKLMVGDPEDKWDIFRKFNEESVAAPILGFSFDETPVLDQMAGCKNVSDEYLSRLVNGAVDPEVEHPKFMEKLRSVGLQEIIDEMQRQYDDWRASNE